VCLSFYLKDDFYKSYEHASTIEGQVKEYRGDHYIIIQGHKILLKGQIESGYYKIESDFYEQTYKNPNTFDYSSYLKSIGFSGVIFLDRAKVECMSLDIEKRYEFNSLYNDFYRGILFADKSGLDYENFKVNGTSHILAISGLHIGILYGLFYLVFSKTQHKHIMASLLVFAYIAYLKFPLSAVRAYCMILMTLVAIKTNRKYDVLQTLALIAIVMIIYNPFVVFNSGFQFSMIAVILIEVCFNGIFRLIESRLLKIILLPLVIQLGMMPLMIYHQNQVHLLGFLPNIISVFFIAWVIYGLLVYIIIPMPIILEFVDYIFEIIIKVNDYFYHLIDYKMTLPSPPLILLIALYLLIILYREKRLRRWLIIFMIALMLMTIVYKCLVIEVYFFDIGQGDSILIRKGFTDLLIDGGKVSENKRLQDIVHKQGSNSIEYLMVSHSDMDHIGGLIGLDQLLGDSTLIYNSPNETTEAFLTIPCHSRIESYGQIFDFGFCSFEPIEYQVGESNNDSSLIGYLNLYDTKIFLSGDIESSVESSLSLKPVDILKVPHHGSKTSSSQGFLNQLAPKVSVICVGDNNYGHPHKEVLDRLNQRSQVLMTKEGCIKVYILPFGIYFVKSLN